MDYLYIGPSPYEEDCVQVGTRDYHTKAMAECRRFRALIKKKLGVPPQGARLVIKGNPHDLGSYYEVCVEFDDDNAEAVEYALKCEREAPATWDE